MITGALPSSCRGQWAVGGSHPSVKCFKAPPKRETLCFPLRCRPSRARPGRNEPALLPHVLRAVSLATGRSEEDVAQQTNAVAREVFGLH